MPHHVGFRVRRVLPASSEAVWRVLGDFGTEHRWTRSLRLCSRDTADVQVGTARKCELPRPLMGRISVREVLTEYDPGTSLAYVLDGAAGPFASAASRWSTSTVSAQATAVVVDGHLVPRNAVVRLFLWPFAKPYLRSITARVLDELGEYVRDSGQATPAR
ncbi:MAG TPA: SRPBCC family protein [Solirubrobacteraceae bacterium]|nr:SRPBCC family protein [Solirubrobacteraceae bacterium]